MIQTPFFKGGLWDFTARATGITCMAQEQYGAWLWRSWSDVLRNQTIRLPRLPKPIPGAAPSPMKLMSPIGIPMSILRRFPR